MDRLVLKDLLEKFDIVVCRLIDERRKPKFMVSALRLYRDENFAQSLYPEVDVYLEEYNTLCDQILEIAMVDDDYLVSKVMIGKELSVYYDGFISSAERKKKIQANSYAMRKKSILDSLIKNVK